MLDGDEPISSTAPTKTHCLACGGRPVREMSQGRSQHGRLECRWCDDGFQTPEQIRRWEAHKARKAMQR